MALKVPNATLAGIVAFLTIVNMPRESFPAVLRETKRGMKPGGLLLLAFHNGDDTLHLADSWGRVFSMDVFLFQPSAIQHSLEAAGLVIDRNFAREPYPPEVEYQSRRACILVRKSAAPAQR